MLLGIAAATRGIGSIVELGRYVAHGGRVFAGDTAPDWLGAALHAAVAVVLIREAGRIATWVFPGSDDQPDSDGLERILSAALVVAGLSLAASTVQLLVATPWEVADPPVPHQFAPDAVAMRRKSSAIQFAGSAITAAAGLVLALRSNAIAHALAARGRPGRDDDG